MRDRTKAPGMQAKGKEQRRIDRAGGQWGGRERKEEIEGGREELREGGEGSGGGEGGG